MDVTRSSGASDASAQHEEVQQLLPSQVTGSSSPHHRARLHDHDSRQLSIPAFEVDDSGRAFKPGGNISGSLGSNDTGSIGPEADHTRAVLCLCGAHALARWGWRTWEFAVALILIKLFPASLLSVAIFGVLDNIARLACGSVIGQFVDRTERLRGALTCYAIQNICIAVSAAAAAALVLLNVAQEGPSQHPLCKKNGACPLFMALYWCLACIMLLVGASSSIGSLGAAVAVEREYAKTLCGDDSSALRKLNAALRAIDLLSQMLGPVVSGLLMTYSSLFTAVVVLALYSLGAWLPEALLLQAALRHSPRLRQPKASEGRLHQQLRPNALRALLGAEGWSAYFQQSTLLPGLALALLYLTVLSLGFLMTSFLAWQGMSEATISVFRSAGALSGLLATVVFHPLQRCGVGLVGAASLGVTWQLVCLLVGVTPVVAAQWLSHPPTPRTLLRGNVTHSSGTGAFQKALTSRPPGLHGGPALPHNHHGLPQHLLYVLLSGLVASRFGLWLFDLAVTQLQQELVPEAQLGTVSGVQASLQSAFEVMSFLVGALINRPQQFHWLMAGSCAAACAAAGLFQTYACRQRAR